MIRFSKYPFGIAGFSLLSLCSVQFAAAEHEGGNVGNGGIAVVCRDATTHKIKSAELLDLYEAKRIHKWILNENTLTKDFHNNKETAAIAGLVSTVNTFLNYVSPNHGQIYSGLLADATRPFLSTNIKEALNPNRKVDSEHTLAQSLDTMSLRPEEVKVETRISVIGDDQELPLTHDFTSDILPKGCHYEQVATYASDGTLFIDPVLFAAMNSLNQGALFYHEAIWAIHRQAGLTSSDLARRQVGVTYALLEREALKQTVKNAEYKELLRQIAILGHLTLKLYYNYTGLHIFHLLELKADQRGMITFGYEVTGNLNAMTCESTTGWQSWLTDKELHSFKLDSDEDGRGYNWMKNIELAIGNVGGGQVVPEYLGLRYTSLNAQITCKLKNPTGLLGTQVSVRFIVRKGHDVIVNESMGSEVLSISKPSTTLTYKPVLFF